MNCEILPLDMAMDVSVILKEHSLIHNEFQLNPVSGRSFPPGGLQYNENDETFIDLDIDGLKSTSNDYYCGWVLENHTKENVLRLIPKTTTGQKIKDKLKLILVIKKNYGSGEFFCLKAAFRNTETNKIVLMTSKNYFDQPVERSSRLLNSYDNEYKVCQCRMIAPLFFWDELKNRLLN